jgi:ubiquinone/menaquinone biosynthesis C-methylase UbiE
MMDVGKRATELEFSAEEVREVLTRVEERNEKLREVGFDFVAAVRGILEQALPLPLPVLEIATGKGRFLAELARHVADIVTVDCDAQEQRVAKILALDKGVAERIRFVEGDASHLPFPNESFGSIVSMNTFHHLENPDAVLNEMARLVRRDGKVVISDFNEDGYAAMERLHASEGRVHPRSSVSMEHIADFWRRRGWNVKITSAPCQEIVLAFGPEHQIAPQK